MKKQNAGRITKRLSRWPPRHLLCRPHALATRSLNGRVCTPGIWAPSLSWALRSAPTQAPDQAGHTGAPAGTERGSAQGPRAGEMAQLAERAGRQNLGRSFQFPSLFPFCFVVSVLTRTGTEGWDFAFRASPGKPAESGRPTPSPTATCCRLPASQAHSSLPCTGREFSLSVPADRLPGQHLRFIQSDDMLPAPKVKMRCRAGGKRLASFTSVNQSKAHPLPQIKAY